MLRRSFRFGLWAGVLTGLVLAVVRTMRARQEAQQLATTRAPASAWPPIPSPSDATEPGMEAPRGADRVANLGETVGQADVPATAGAADMVGVAGRAVPDATADAPSAPSVSPSGTAGVDPSAAPEPVTELAPEPLVDVTTTRTTAPAGNGSTADAGDVTEAPAGQAPPLEQTWVVPEGEACPATHPIKAKLSSRIFHVPGGLNYARTRADRCYVSEEAAEADGFTRAKR